MTLYETRFYCGTEDNKIFFVGRYGGIIDIAKNNLLTSRDFLNKHYDEFFEYVTHSPVIKFKESEDTVFEHSQTENKEGRQIIFLWTGNRAPKCCNTVMKWVLPTDKTEKKCILSVPAWRCDLSLDSLLYIGKPPLFLSILNRFIRQLSEADQKTLLEGGKFLRSIMFQDESWFQPYCYTYFRPIEEVSVEQKQSLKKCPADCLPCEMAEFYKGFFIFIPKSKWIKKESIKEEDLIMGD
jgi:hypothetical protein